MPEAHAIDIERCSECPFGADSATMPEQKTGQCSHPNIMVGARLDVLLDDPPPFSCPLRPKLTVLRVTVPPHPQRNRHLRGMH